MIRYAAAGVVAAVAFVSGIAWAAPAPTTPQEWCRVVDVETGEEVTIPCHRDPTTTTTAPTTTLPATTTLAPTTTSTTSTTSSTTVAPTTTLPAPDGFLETFDNNTGADRFERGVYHRGIGRQTYGEPATVWGTQGYGIFSDTWDADHDLACGGPDTSRSLTSNESDLAVGDLFYVCRDHLMSSVGPVDGYSIGWFSPDGDGDGYGDVFTDATTVSWDVNATNLGSRQWWEVVIVAADGPTLTCLGWLPCDFGGNVTQPYPDDAIVVTNMPAVVGFSSSTDKATRFTYSITDNQNGTVTIDGHGQVPTQTIAGEFPPGGFRVLFKDHNYEPLKDGPVVGFTWHWDNIAVG